MRQLLLIDDDPVVVPAQIRKALRSEEVSIRIATSGAEGVACVRANPPDVILLDLRLPDQTGLEVFEHIRALDARIPVIFITSAKSADTAIEAMKHGAYNYLHKPLDLAQLQATVAEAFEVARRMRSEVVLAGPDRADDVSDGGAILGGCRAMLDVYKSIGRVAAQDVTVLITGESGTGKELVARAIYQHSVRAKGPFLALNCAAIPEPLLESELFGHERGAFTGADRRRIGKFEQCRGGTLLLDEIGDMPLGLQAKILRVLQEKTFERVGGNETIQADVRIIASTHRDLRARAAEDRFRPDLYYRLGVFNLHLPPLRDREEDLAMLVRHYLKRFGGELGREVVDVSPDAMAKLQAHRWPGNVRELQSVLKQALLAARGRVLLPAFLPPFDDEARAAADRGPTMLADARKDVDAPELERFIAAELLTDKNDLYATTHAIVDRLLFKRVLAHTGGNQRDAAKLLGISRQTMRMKLRALGLAVTPSVEAMDTDLRDD